MPPHSNPIYQSYSHSQTSVSLTEPRACMQLGLLCIFQWALVWDWVLFGSDNKIEFEWGLDMCVSRALESGVEVRFWRARNRIWQWVAHNNADANTVLNVHLLNLAKMIPEMDIWIEWYTKSKTLKETYVLRCCCVVISNNINIQ